MTSEYDAAYYQRRERNARALAARAVNPEIARIHTQMADGYATQLLRVDPTAQPSAG